MAPPFLCQHDHGTEPVELRGRGRTQIVTPKVVRLSNVYQLSQVVVRSVKATRSLRLHKNEICSTLLTA